MNNRQVNRPLMSQFECMVLNPDHAGRRDVLRMRMAHFAKTDATGNVCFSLLGKLPVCNFGV